MGSSFEDQDRYVPTAITPSDSTDVTARQFRGYMVSVDGNVALTTSQGEVVTLVAIAGVEYHFGFAKLMATNTTATGIFALI